MKNHLVSIAFCALLLALSACASLGLRASAEFRGATYGSPAPPPDFELASTAGDSFSLHRDGRGEVVLIFFGYTFCPDICPATLGSIKTALNQLTSQQREQVLVLFVTTDPGRDSLERTAGYLERYQAGFIGLVPDESQLAALKADFGVYAEIEGSVEDGKYLIAHTGLVYVLDKAGNLRAGFLSDMAPEDMLHDLQILLRE